MAQETASRADINSVAPRLSARLRPSAEDGFGIIEVLVSAILVIIVSTGVFVAFDAATNASGTNKARSAAANLARSDQERLRGMTAQQLSTLPSTPQPQVVDGRTFQVTSTTTWVADRTGTPSCTSADGRADYLRLRTSVTWNRMGSLNPVVLESLRAIPRGAFRPNQGSILVKIVDRNGTGVPGASVSVTGTQAFSGTTNANGCVLIDQVPVGTYSLTVAKAGFVVDTYPNAAVFTKSNFTVAKEQTSSILGTMDQAGTARVQFRTTTAAGGTTEADTTGEGFTIANTGLVTLTTRSFLLASGSATTLYSGAGAAALTTNATRSVFPFSSRYTMWAGACNEANPTLRTPAQPVTALQLVPPGSFITTPTADYFVREPRMEIRVLRYSTAAQVGTSVTNVTNQRVTVTPSVAACGRAASANTGTTTPTTSIATFTMPYGQYQICAQDSTSTTSARRRRGVLRINGAANGTAYNAVYNGGASEPANGAIILPFAASSSPGAAC